MPAIEIQELHKSYGAHVALRGISATINDGEIVGLLGPNGAGKSTTMKILTGFLAPSSGSTRVAGHDVLENPIAAQEKLGYLPEHAPIYLDMRVRDYLDYIGRIRNMGGAGRARAIERVAGWCGITDRLGQICRELSNGYRQRVGLAQALLHSPDILVLDEPTTGLDPNQKEEILDLIRGIGESRTVILSTHILPDVQATCDRVLIIDRGLLVEDGSTEEVTTRTMGGQILHVVLAEGAVAPVEADVVAALQGIDGVVRVTPRTETGTFAFELQTDRDVRKEIFQLAVARGLILLELAPDRTDLVEVFRQLTVAG